MPASIFDRVALWLHRGAIRERYANVWAAHRKAVAAKDTRAIHTTRQALNDALKLKLEARC